VVRIELENYLSFHLGSPQDLQIEFINTAEESGIAAVLWCNAGRSTMDADRGKNATAYFNSRGGKGESGLKSEFCNNAMLKYIPATEKALANQDLSIMAKP
jgi:hypothetical protein